VGEVAALVVLNLAYLIVGAAAFLALRWVDPSVPSTWPRLGAAYLAGVVVVVVPASYLALAGVPVELSAAGVGVAVVCAAAWQLRHASRPRLPSPRRPGAASIVALGITVVGVGVLAYALRTFTTRPLVDNDAWAIWTLRGRLLYANPSAAASAMRTGRYGPSPYPLALPTLDALGFHALRQFDGTVIGSQLLFLLGGFVAALWGLLHRLAHPVAIALAAVAVVAAPEMIYQLLTQYADVPLGLFVGLGVAAAAAWTAARNAQTWLLGCTVVFLTMAGLIKSEGFMFVVAACIALVVAQLGRDRRDRLLPALVAVGAIAACLAPWRLYCAAYNLTTPAYELGNVVHVGYLRTHTDRVGPAVRELLRQLVNTHSWGFLVAAILSGLVTGLLARRFRPTLFAALWLGLGLAGLILIYWISTLPTANNLDNSSFRTIVSLLIGGTAMLPVLITPGSTDRGPARAGSPRTEGDGHRRSGARARSADAGTAPSPPAARAVSGRVRSSPDPPVA
jgi:hypothetical protein